MEEMAAESGVGIDRLYGFVRARTLAEILEWNDGQEVSQTRSPSDQAMPTVLVVAGKGKANECQSRQTVVQTVTRIARQVYVREV